jgi:hypothetical protein
MPREPVVPYSPYTPPSSLLTPRNLKKAFDAGRAAGSAVKKYMERVRKGRMPMPKRGKPSGSGTMSHIKSENGMSSRGGTATKVRSVKKNKRKPKVSPEFRKKVRASLIPTPMQGIYTDTMYDQYNCGVSDGQNVYDVGFGKNYAYMFDPNTVIDMASVLWNSKDPSFQHLYDTLSFDRGNVVIKVIDSKSDLMFKNNTRRTLTFDLYECLAKAPRDALAQTPLQAWSAALLQDSTSGTVVPGYNAYANGGTIAPPTINHLDQRPGMTSAFNQYYKSTKRSFVLEPGQTINHTVRGPKDVLYDYSKFSLNGIFNPHQSGKNVGLILVLQNDLVGAANGSSVGRFSSQNYDGESLLIERKDTYVLGMPEQAGFQYPASIVGTQRQTLGQRKRRICHNVYVNGVDVTAANQVRVDEENPLAPEVFP